MGKRRKISSSTTSNAADPVLPDGGSESEHKKKTKVSNSKDIRKLDDNVNIPEINEVSQKKKGKKRNTNLQIPVSEEVSESSSVIEDNMETREKKKHQPHKTFNQVSQDQETVECLSQNSFSNSPSTSKSKKLIFIDDQPQEVIDAPQMATKTNKNKNKSMNNEEEEVNDEDIDKFCDELTEEDNIQYESWIKLVEAKMHPNKKN